MRRLILQALCGPHRVRARHSLVAGGSFSPIVPPIREACGSFYLFQTWSQLIAGDGSAALPAGAAARVSKPLAQTGQPGDSSHLSCGPVSKAVCEHLHCGRSGSLSSTLSNPLPRLASQLGSQSDLQPELHLRQHGSPLRHISLPSLGIDSAFDGQHRRQFPLFSADRSRLVHQSHRGFRTSASLLADESDGSSDVVVKEDAPEVLDEKKPKYGPRRSQKIPREIIGSYDEEFEDELDLAEQSPWQDVLYNIRPRVDKFLINEMGANPPLDLEDLVATADDLGLVSEIPDEYAGLPLLLRWETRFVLAPGPSAQHGLNRKVKLQAYLRDLGLSNEERERMIALVGPRYNKRKDELTLISQRYPQREENRKDVLRILYALIDESKRRDSDELAAAA